jgi:hypothetical protein
MGRFGWHRSEGSPLTVLIPEPHPRSRTMRQSERLRAQTSFLLALWSTGWFSMRLVFDKNKF